MVEIGIGTQCKGMPVWPVRVDAKAWRAASNSASASC